MRFLDLYSAKLGPWGDFRAIPNTVGAVAQAPWLPCCSSIGATAPQRSLEAYGGGGLTTDQTPEVFFSLAKLSPGNMLAPAQVICSFFCEMCRSGSTLVATETRDMTLIRFILRDMDGGRNLIQ